MQPSLIITVSLWLSNFCDATFVDPSYPISPWEGWGTRLGHWGNVVGGFKEEVVNEIADALFSPKNLNLNKVRYAIGATTPGDNSCGDFAPGAAIESFQDGIDQPILKTRNPTARKLLLAAKQYGADTFEAFSFSPPSWMTRSNCSKGNPEGAPLHDNFDPEYANTFANYLTEVVKFYHESYNISFSHVCPFFEPSSGVWIGPSSEREGCNMELSTIAEVIKSLHASLDAKNLTFCHQSVSSEKYFTQSLTTQNYLIENGIDDMYSNVGFTGFPNGDQKLSELSTLGSRIGKKLEQNNHGVQPGSLPNINPGVQLATEIVLHIRRLAITSWGISEAIPGLLSISYSDPNIEGYTIIQITDCDEQCVAAYSTVEKILIIVVVNPALEPERRSIDLSTFSALGKVVIFRTSSLDPHVPVPSSLVTQKQLNLDIPKQSITTIKISNAVSYERTNLLKNGDFELTSQIPVAWSLLYGDRSDNGINGNYVYRGNNSGNLDFTASSLTLMQNTTATFPRIHHLSAWCAATGPGVWLGISINGQFRTEVEIKPDRGYMLYGQSVDGREGDVISVYLRSERGAHSAQIDDVALH